ncbi:MAG TPA: hypothetical protein VFL83_16755 [Anaeromyxobacter sp.]|nr:hypothetical protein [Anaeromyxobacter sp.]
MAISVTQPLAIACPSCGLTRTFAAGAAPSRFPRQCPGCGAELVVEGLLQPTREAEPGSDLIPYPAGAGGARDDAAFLPAPAAWQAAGVAAFAALLAWSHLSHGVLAAVVSGADLVFHEAGHPVFGILGSRLLMYLGGTIAQLAIPLAAAAAFALRRRTAAFAVALVWVGFNLESVGAYAADAMDRALPLLAPDADSHDWWNILGILGLRERCRGIGGAIAGAGWALWAGAPAWLGWRWLRAWDRAAVRLS